jgi:hypothetical protein
VRHTRKNPGRRFEIRHYRGLMQLVGPDGRLVLSIHEGSLPSQADEAFILSALNDAGRTIAAKLGTAQRQLKRTVATAALRRKTNPSVRSKGPEIYERVLAIQAQKRGDPRTVWTHRFPRRLPASAVIGLPDGSVLIKANGKPLWGDV